LRANGITYRTDSSNASIKYQRNRIRHTVLPLWKAENPSVVEGLARLGEQLWVQRRYMEAQARSIVDQSILSADQSGLTLHVAELTRHDQALDPYILRELVCRLGLDMVPRDATASRFAALRNWKSHRGSYSLEQGELSLQLSQGFIKVCKSTVRPLDSETTVERDIAPKVVTRVVGATLPARTDDKVMARFDLDAVEGVVSVRWPKPGDRYQPLGLHGTKKLSDLLADRKVPSFERSLVPVVVDDQGILWPIGHPIAHRARLTDRTERVMEARLQEESWKNSC
jgi:tRNA(Ile)-lysidine synthase